jgi:type II secretory pathway pseudopilin PulG
MTHNQESIFSNATYGGWGCLSLLMVIGVIGAIALPSFLTTTCTPRISEATSYVGSMNKAQQAHFSEKSAFATSVNALGIGIKTETTNYKYSVRATKKAGFNYAVAKEKFFKSYVGGVFLVPSKNFDPNAAQEEITTTSLLCKADFPGTIKPAEPTYEKGKIACGKGTTQVTK